VPFREHVALAVGAVMLCPVARFCHRARSECCRAKRIFFLSSPMPTTARLDMKFDKPVPALRLPAGFAAWLTALQDRVRTAQLQAAARVNQELLGLSWVSAGPSSKPSATAAMASRWSSGWRPADRRSFRDWPDFLL
jgi:hypothetical protein